MNNQFKLNNLIPYVAFILIILVVTSPWWGIRLYEYWTGFLVTDNRFEAIGTVIAYVGGVINIVTIIFLYINFHQQKQDNLKKDKETEFNRLVNIIYKQEVNTTALFKKAGEKIKNLNSLLKRRHIHKIFSQLDSYYAIIQELSEEMNFYYEFFHKSQLNKDDLHVLNRIIKQNFIKEFNEIKTSYILLDVIKNTDEDGEFFKRSFINYLKASVLSQPDLVKLREGLLTDEMIFEENKNTYLRQSRKISKILNYLELINSNDKFYTKKLEELEQ